jgi:hypothetical protein
VKRDFPGINSQESPGRPVQWEVFYGLDRVAGKITEEVEAAARYVLNSVDFIQVTTNEVVIRGVCSDVLDPLVNDNDDLPSN